MNKTPLPGWTLHTEEVSNGKFEVTLTNAFGHQVQIADNQIQQTIEKAAGFAFDIEKQVSKNWNLFLFNLSVQLITGDVVVDKAYHDNSFGSWHIETRENRLIYDGKDGRLILEYKSSHAWTERLCASKVDLTYADFIGFIATIHNS